jgi:hypothetical protein|tara:strand:+ start:285 stop:560 length:276 start_codon:yes stop_codon:yes gene_type:complete
MTNSNSRHINLLNNRQKLVLNALCLLTTENKMTNPIEPTQLVHTPDSMEDFIAIVDSLSGEERIVAYTYSMMAWNLACKITEDHLKEYHND